MKRQARMRLALACLLIPVGILLAYAILRTGPMAPVAVTLASPRNAPLSPALFGIGNIEARHEFRMAPTRPGRVARINADVGDRVRAGQVVATMDALDLDDTIVAKEAAIAGADAASRAAEARIVELEARLAYAAAQESRHELLLRTQAVSAEAYEARRQESAALRASIESARASRQATVHELARLEAERKALLQHREELSIRAPVDALVTQRLAEPGSVLAAGQPLLMCVDPAAIWIAARFDQGRSGGLAQGLPARITLRTAPQAPVAGHVARIEPIADAVTEETLARIGFDTLPSPLPSLGGLCEVTIGLPPLPPAPVLPQACIHRIDGREGVWTLDDDDTPRFTPLRLGAADLDGQVQVLEGIDPDARVILHSMTPISPRTRIRVVDKLPGVPHD